MRSLKRNQQKIYYKTLVKTSDTDKFGNEKFVKSELKEIYISLSGNKGDATNQFFGTSLDYDRTMSISRTDCEIDENTVLWIDKKSEESYDYKVIKKSVTLNETVFAIKRVNVNEPKD